MLSAGAGMMAVPAAAQGAALVPTAGKDDTAMIQAAIDRAAAGDGIVTLAAGTFTVSGLRLAKPLQISGVAGRSVLQARGPGPLLSAEGFDTLTLSGVTFDGAGRAVDLMMATGVQRLALSHCDFRGAQKVGLKLTGCGGSVSACRFQGFGDSALFALDSAGLEISGNDVEEADNNGIQVWTSEPRHDGTMVCHNRVSRIRALAGGSGQYGNGISVFRAGGVMISANQVSACAFSGIRNNSGHNCQITGNAVTGVEDVGIYVEFAFDGAVVSHNLIDGAAVGISITNYDVGGRLAVCSNNLVRNITGGHVGGAAYGYGIYAEADTLVNSNVIENARDAGILLGWGPKCPNLTAQGNLVKDCDIGIAASVSPGAGPHVIANNLITGARLQAVAGKNFLDTATADLAVAGAAAPPSLTLLGNTVTH